MTNETDSVSYIEEQAKEIKEFIKIFKYVFNSNLVSVVLVIAKLEYDIYLGKTESLLEGKMLTIWLSVILFISSLQITRYDYIIKCNENDRQETNDE